MLRSEHWMLFLFGLIIFIYMTFVLHVIHVDIQTDENRQAETNLIEASKSALRVADIDKICIFKEKETREACFKEFNDTFNFGYDFVGINKKKVDFMVPCVFLVDDDGYYVRYSKLVESTGISELTTMETDINTWTKAYGSYLVRYHLSNIVEVTTSNGEVYYGYYDKVFNEINRPSDLSFFIDQKQFEEEKNHVVCSIMEENINYFVTTHNEYANSDMRKYIFTMPQYDNIKSRLMDAPSVIAFVQGSQRSNGKGYVNAYSLTGAIKDKAINYYECEVNGNLYYHIDGCPDLVLNEDNSIAKTMDDCALDGFLPCPECIK